MIRYGKCTNIDDNCPNAKSGEVIIVEGAKEFVCPSCGEGLFEVPKPEQKRPKWLRPALIIALLCLSASLIWALWPKSPSTTPLSVKQIALNCDTGLLSLSTFGGDQSSITYKVEGISQSTLDNSFTIPDSLRNGGILLIYASQSGRTVDTTFATTCVTPPSPYTSTVGGGGSEERPTQYITWTRVPGSEFCVDIPGCVQTYNEINNLGQIRERRIKNCIDCAEANE